MKHKGFKKIFMAILLITMLFSSSMPVFAKTILTDINGHWASRDINQFIDMGYIRGYEDKTFRPNNSITRAEFLIVVNNVFGFTKKGNENFNDIKPGDWYYDAVCIAMQEGYIKGYENFTFRPNNKISREEAAVIIANIKKYTDNNFDKLNKYNDVNNVSNWAKSAMEVSLEEEYIKGYEDKTIRPKKDITRGEAVTILSRVKNDDKPIEVVDEVAIPVLMYHHFENDREQVTGSIVQKIEFIKQMKYLKDNGYTAITSNDLLEHKNGNKDLPDKPILITADDGYLSNYEFMYPVAKEYGMKFTIFSIGERIDNANNSIGIPKFNWDQAREMYYSGIVDIQSHTYNSHDKSETIKGYRGNFSAPLIGENTEEYKIRIDEDIKTSIKGIEENLGYKPIAFAYPFGEFSDVAERVLKDNGIKLTFTVRDGFVESDDDTYLLNRITVSGYDSISTFINKLKNSSN